jgi:hypothetical protein
MSAARDARWRVVLVRHWRGSRDPAWLYDEYFAVPVLVLVSGLACKYAPELSPALWACVAVPALVYCGAHLLDYRRVRRGQQALRAKSGDSAGGESKAAGNISAGGRAGPAGCPATGPERLCVVGNAAEVVTLRSERGGAYPYRQTIWAWRVVLGLMAVIVIVRHLLHFPGCTINPMWTTWPLAGLFVLLLLSRLVVYAQVEVRPGWLQVRPSGVLRLLGWRDREVDLARAEVCVDFKERVLEVRDAGSPVRISLVSTWYPHELAHHVLHAAAGVGKAVETAWGG